MYLEDTKSYRGEVISPLKHCKKASNHHANLPLKMYSFTL